MKIPEIKLVAKPESDAAKEAIGFKFNPDIGFSHKIGGEPDFVQSGEDWPSCCGRDMTFYAQLDSVGDQYSLGDAGMVFVFVCFDCFASSSFVESH